MPREREAVSLDFIVLGGDARMPALAKRLREGGFEARHMAKPTAEALALAKSLRLTLIGRAREAQYELFTP